VKTEQVSYEQNGKGKQRLDEGLMADSVKKVLFEAGHQNSSFSYEEPYKFGISTPSSDGLTFPSSSSKGSSSQSTQSTASFASANLFSSSQLTNWCQSAQLQYYHPMWLLWTIQ
jgi:hypothetical protein